MADKTGISWTDSTWNPIRGCSKVSAGCKNCYAEKVAARFSGPGSPYEGTVRDGRWNGQIRLVPDMLAQPLKWRRPRRVFVNSMSDLFHDDVPFEFVAAVFGVMAACPHHTFQVLTKRPARAVEFFAWVGGALPSCHTGGASRGVMWYAWDRGVHQAHPGGTRWPQWPLPNVHLGVSVEDQKTADARIPLLLQCPAAVRFVSYEPALGPVDFIGWGADAPAGPADATPERWADFKWPEWVTENERTNIEWFWREEWGRGPRAWMLDHVHQHVPASGTRRMWSIDKSGWVSVSKQGPGEVAGRYLHCWNNIGRIITDDGRVLMASGGAGASWLWRRDDNKRINWIIVGGESGPGARPFNVAWARSTIKQCRAAGVACFVKQLGARPLVPFGETVSAWPVPLWIADHPDMGPPFASGMRPAFRNGHGADPSEWHEDLRVQEFPNTPA